MSAVTGWARALACVGLWGASFVAIAVSLRSFTPWGLVEGRLLVGGACLLAVQLARGRPLLPGAPDRPRVALLGAILALHMGLQAVGMQTTTAVNTGWIIAAIPAAIALGAWLFLRQRLAPRGWLGVLLATSGVFVVVGGSPAALVDARTGDLLQVASCFTWAAYTLAASSVVARHGALSVTCGSMVVAALLALPVALTQGWTHAAPAPGEWLAFAYLAFACSAVAYVFWYQALSVLGPVRTGSVLYTQPFVTLATSALVLGESGGGATLLGGLIVLTGVALVQLGVRRRPLAAPPGGERPRDTGAVVSRPAGTSDRPGRR